MSLLSVSQVTNIRFDPGLSLVMFSKVGKYCLHISQVGDVKTTTTSLSDSMTSFT